MAMTMPPAKKKRSYLDQLSMPNEKDPAAGMEEGSPEEEASESPEDEAAEDAAGEAPDSDDMGGKDLSAVSDEDLMAEMKKRGLMGDMGGESDHGDSSEDETSIPGY